MQGGLLWNQYTDPIEDENNVIIYTRNKIKTKYEDKISLKDNTKCIIYTRRRSIRSMQFMHIDSLGN